MKTPFRFRWEHELRDRAGETGLPLQAIGVLTLMATYADIDGKRVFVSDVAMAQRVGCSRKTWLKWRTCGAAAGWIRLVEERPGRSNVYDLSIPVAGSGHADRATGQGQVPGVRGLSVAMDRCVPAVTHPVSPVSDTTSVGTSTPTNTSTCSGEVVVDGDQVVLGSGEVVTVPSFDSEGDTETTPRGLPEDRPIADLSDLRVAGAAAPVAASAARSPGLSGRVNNSTEFVAGACPCRDAAEHYNAVVELPPYPTDNDGNLLSSWGQLGYAFNREDRMKFERIAYLRDAHDTQRTPDHSPSFYTPAQRAKDRARHQGFHDRTTSEENPMEAYESDPKMQHYIEMVHTGEIRDWNEVPPPLQQWAAGYLERRGHGY